MLDTLDLDTFRRLLAGRTIDVARAANEYRLGGVDLAKVDLDRDGRISTRSEIDALFRQIDKADTNGDRYSVRFREKDGRWNDTSNKLQVIGELAGVDIFRELSRDAVVLVGMNKGSRHEAAALKRGGRHVVYITNSKVEDNVDVGGTRYNLRNDGDLARFVGLLGLPAGQAGQIAEAIKASQVAAADELATIAWNWAPAEKGADIPRRLVLSGHSYGEGVFGDGNGHLVRDVIAKLAKAMPKAAGQVEDLHISGCYTAGAYNMARWREIFPNVLTIWAYTGSAPGSGNGATAHLILWDHATRGSKDAIDRLIAAKTNEGESVAVWSLAHGYKDGRPPVALATLKARLSQQDPVFPAYFSGEKEVGSPYSGELRRYYNTIQELLQRLDLPAGEKPALETKRDVTIRLLYYSKSIRGKFATTHARLISQGYASLGLTPPDFGKLSRKDALAAIRRFTDAAKTRPSLPGDAQAVRPMLEQGLRDLLPGPIPAIPETWI